MAGTIEKENYKKKGLLNLIANGINFIANLGVAFFVSPVIIKGLGDTFYGIWKVLNQLTGYLNTVEFQTTDTLKWVVAKKRAEIGQDELRKEVAAAIVVATMVIPIFIVGGVLMVYYAPSIVNVSDDYIEIVRISMAILVFGFILKKYTSIPLAVLQGMNLGYKKVGLQAFLQLLNGGLNVYIILYTDLGIVGLAIVNIIIAIIGGILFLYFVKIFVPWFGLSMPERSRIIDFFKTSGWLFLWTIASLLLISSDMILLGYLATPALVTTYVVTRFLPELLTGVNNLIARALMPGFGNLIGNESIDKAEKGRNLLMLISWILCVSLGASILLVSGSFVSIWVGAERYGGNMITLLLIVIAMQYIFIKNDSMLIITSLSMKENFLLTLFAGLVSLVLKILLIPELEILGLCLSMVIGRLILSIAMPLLLNSIIKIRTSFVSTIRPLILTVVILVAAYYVSDFIYLKNYISIGVIFGLSSVLVFGIIFMLGINKLQRSELLGIVKGLNINS